MCQFFGQQVISQDHWTSKTFGK